MELTPGHSQKVRAFTDSTKEVFIKVRAERMPMAVSKDEGCLGKRETRAGVGVAGTESRVLE